MRKSYLFIFLIFLLPIHIFCIIYSLSNEPIDVVIPCAKKDQEILDLCINGIRKNGKNIRNIIVISSELYTNEAKWFDEKNFPFSKNDIADEIFQNNLQAKQDFLSSPRTRIGWIYQQLLKLYSPFVIPGISKNVLVLDADTIFLNSVEFTNDLGDPLFAIAKEYYKPYFDIAQKILPEFYRVNKKLSGICHHMIFQRSILENLFSQIQLKTREEPWQAICHAIDKTKIYQSTFSEYELYFNFVFITTNQGKIRPLKWGNIYNINAIESLKKDDYSFISLHSWMRQK